MIGEVFSLVNKAKVKFPESIKCGTAADRCVMAAHRSVKRQIRLNSEDIRITFVDPNSWLEDWDFARDGLYINRGARRLKPAILQGWWTRRHRKDDRVEGTTNPAMRESEVVSSEEHVVTAV